MSRFELEPVDGGASIHLTEGETHIGRGPFLGVSDKRVSRNHGLLEMVDGQLRIKPTHQNPCFYQPSPEDPPQPLERDRWHPLRPGNLFSLLPGKYVFRVVSVNGDETKSNSQGFEEEMPVADAPPTSAKLDEEPARSPEMNGESESESKSEPKTQTTQDQGGEAVSSCSPDKEGEVKTEATVTKEQKVESGELGPRPEQRKRVLPAWMMQTAAEVSSPSTSTGDKRRGKAKATPTKAKRPRAKKGRNRSASEEEEEEEEESEQSEVERAPRKKAKKLKSKEEEEEEEEPKQSEAKRAPRKRVKRLKSEEEEEEEGEESEQSEAVRAPRKRVKRLKSEEEEEEEEKDDALSKQATSGEATSRRPRGPSNDDESGEASAYVSPGPNVEKGEGRRNGGLAPKAGPPGGKRGADATGGEEKESRSRDGKTPGRGGQEVGGAVGAGPSRAKAKAPPRPPCPYGKDCYRKNPLHFTESSHPGDSDYEQEEDEEEKEEDDNRPECPYGTSCYRKNPQHKKEYKHSQDPGTKARVDDEDDGEEDAWDEDSFINDDSGDLDEDSDYVPPESEDEDVQRLKKEAKAFLKRKR